MIATPITAIPRHASPAAEEQGNALTHSHDNQQQLALSEGLYIPRDDVLLDPVPSHPNFPHTPSTNVLDTTSRPLIAGVTLARPHRTPRKISQSVFNDVLGSVNHNGTSGENTHKPKSPAANGSTRLRNLATGNLKAYVGGEYTATNNTASAKDVKDASKKKKPKNNILKNASSFIFRVTTHETLSKRLAEYDSDAHFAFLNNSRAFLWLDVSTPNQAEQLTRVLFTKAHPLCHDVNVFTKSPSHIDVIIGFSTADVIWYEPVSQKYTHINKNGIINGSAISGIQWLPGSENMFISSHHDGSILILDKERDDAPFVPEEDLQIISPVTRKGVRQVQLRLRKSIRSKNQKSNPVAVYKATKKRINGIECSPDGRFVGLVSEDGTLRIIDLMKEELIDVYTSYFGGMTCLAWSPDGKYIITGGQDDFVSLWSFEDRTIVARCEGPRSWLTALAFDAWRCDGTQYRFGSVGEDRRLLLWDFSVGMLEQPRTSSIRPSISSSFTPLGHTNHDHFQADHKKSADRTSSEASSDDDAIAHAVERRSEVAILPPVFSKEVDEHPLSWIGFGEHYILTASTGGSIRTWIRPPES